jgi:hypothetical protein
VPDIPYQTALNCAQATWNYLGAGAPSSAVLITDQSAYMHCVPTQSHSSKGISIRTLRGTENIDSTLGGRFCDPAAGHLAYDAEGPTEISTSPARFLFYPSSVSRAA